MTDKLYGYYFGDNLKYISPNKELLQEILMDDYFENGFYNYNLCSHSPNAYNYRFLPKDAVSFWQVEKNIHFYLNNIFLK